MKHSSTVIVIALLFLSSSGFAHELRPAFLELRETESGTYDMLWKVPARGNQMRLGLYVRLPDDCVIVEPARSSFVEGAFVERSVVSRNGGMAGAEIYIEGLTATLTDVLARVERLDGSTQVVRLTPSAPSFVVNAAPTLLGVAKTYLILGIQHIWNGIDHLLFVGCLIMVAGSLRRTVVTITGFTIAHSVTLALAALNVVNVPAAPVEACIALSIVFLATEIARPRRDTLTWRYPITVSASFGLLHGFGFASALGRIGLPQTEIPAALLCFNIGVEIGQIVFVLGLLAALRIIAFGKVVSPRIFRYADTPLLQRIAVYIIGSVASFWLIERISAFRG
jgi:hypothetical protein